MAALTCYSCSQSFSDATHPPRLDASGCRVCPGCGSDFTEVIDQAPQAQHRTNLPLTTLLGAMPPAHAHFSTRNAQGQIVDVHMTSATMQAPDFMQLLAAGGGQVLQTDAYGNPTTAMFSGVMPGGMGGFNPGDFAFGDAGMDAILTHFLDSYRPRSAPTAQEVLDRLPRVTVPERGAAPPSGSGSGAGQQPSEPACGAGEPCTVCHDAFRAGEELVQLPCRHCFHDACILPWLKDHNTCPVCRAALPMSGGAAGAGARPGAAPPPQVGGRGVPAAPAQPGSSAGASGRRPGAAPLPFDPVRAMEAALSGAFPGASTSGAGASGAGASGTSGTSGAGASGTSGAGASGTSGAGASGTSGAGASGSSGAGAAGPAWPQRGFLSGGASTSAAAGPGARPAPSGAGPAGPPAGPAAASRTANTSTSTSGGAGGAGGPPGLDLSALARMFSDLASGGAPLATQLEAVVTALSPGAPASGPGAAAAARGGDQGHEDGSDEDAGEMEAPACRVRRRGLESDAASSAHAAKAAHALAPAPAAASSAPGPSGGAGARRAPAAAAGATPQAQAAAPVAAAAASPSSAQRASAGAGRTSAAAVHAHAGPLQARRRGVPQHQPPSAAVAAARQGFSPLGALLAVASAPVRWLVRGVCCVLGLGRARGGA